MSILPPVESLNIDDYSDKRKHTDERGREDGNMSMRRDHRNEKDKGNLTGKAKEKRKEEEEEEEV